MNWSEAEVFMDRKRRETAAWNTGEPSRQVRRAGDRFVAKKARKEQADKALKEALAKARAEGELG